MSTTTDQNPASGISVKSGEASAELHEKIAIYMAQRRLEGVVLTKPKAVIEILDKALEHTYPLSQPAKP
jgi:hypothetical protein